MKKRIMQTVIAAMASACMLTAMGGVASAAPTSADAWDIDTNEWKVSDDGGLTLEKTGNGGDAADNVLMYNFTGAFEISYDVEFAHTADIVDSNTLTLRLPANPEVKVFIRIQGCNNGALIKGQLYNGADGSWTTLFGDDNWIQEVGQNLSVSLTHADGADSMTFLAKAGDKEILKADITHDLLKNDNFYAFTKEDPENPDNNINGMELRLGGDAGDGRFTLSNISVPEEPSAEEPSGEEPGAEEPGTEEPSGEEPSGGESPETGVALPAGAAALAVISAAAVLALRAKKK